MIIAICIYPKHDDRNLCSSQTGRPPCVFITKMITEICMYPKNDAAIYGIYVFPKHDDRQMYLSKHDDLYMYIFKTR